MERINLDIINNIAFEHVHRYYFARSYVNNKIVLDAACGSGYGSFFLSQYANEVYGIDINSEVINHNKKKYQRNNLKFIAAGVERMPFEDNFFDVIISFETIEHVKDHRAVMQEYKRVLKKDGILIISTPNKRISDLKQIRNPFHVREFYEEEFENLLDELFKNKTVLYQSSSLVSMIVKKNFQKCGHIEVLNLDIQKLKYGYIIPNDQECLWFKSYFIVIASDNKIEDEINASLLNENEYYEKQINDMYNSLTYRIGYWLTYPVKFVLHFLRFRRDPTMAHWNKRKTSA